MSSPTQSLSNECRHTIQARLLSKSLNCSSIIMYTHNNNYIEFIMWLYDSYSACVINSCKTTSSIFMSLAHGVLVLGVHTLDLVCMHLSFVGFSLSSRNVSLTTVLYLVHWLPPVLHIIYMQYILHDCSLPVCTQKNTTMSYNYVFSHTTYT